MSHERELKNKINEEEYNRLISTIYPNAKKEDGKHL